MPLLRYHLQPQGPFGTPPRSDTIHGHLVCSAAELDGSKAADELVERLASDSPPFVCSSAMPSGFLPMPSLPPIPRRTFQDRFCEPGGHFKGDLFEALSAYKRFRKNRYISLSVWTECRADMNAVSLFQRWIKDGGGFCPKPGFGQQAWETAHIESHNTIDRSTGTVLDQGGFYLSEASYYCSGAKLDLYVLTDDRPAFERLLKHMADTGFGRDKSVGKGAFSFQRDADFNESLLTGSGTHQMSLSVLSAMDLSGMQGWYSVFAKHGKVWDGLGESNPFKKPFLAIEEGGVFSSLPETGFVLRGVHTDARVVQIARPLTIPLTVTTTEA